nr:MAG TPA: Trp-operon Leader Peptide [Caudoviricetes sp.]
MRCNFIWKYLHCWWRTVWYSGWRLKSAGRKWRFRRWRRR